MTTPNHRMRRNIHFRDAPSVKKKADKGAEWLNEAWCHLGTAGKTLDMMQAQLEDEGASAVAEIIGIGLHWTVESFKRVAQELNKYDPDKKMFQKATEHREEIEEELREWELSVISATNEPPTVIQWLNKIINEMLKTANYLLSGSIDGTLDPIFVTETNGIIFQATDHFQNIADL